MPLTPAISENGIHCCGGRIMSHTSLPNLNQQPSNCAFLLRLRPWGRGILHERLHRQMIQTELV